MTDEICAALPGAIWADPADGRLGSWNVGGKMFAYLGTAGDGVSVKTASVEDAGFLIDIGRAIRAPYFHRSWVRLDWEAQDPFQPGELRDRIVTSYRIVRAGLTKKAQAALGPLPDEKPA
ncbi:MAG: MmcQ/YjbR family DNA-binding protein [Paracoccaceae bacterium]